MGAADARRFVVTGEKYVLEKPISPDIEDSRVLVGGEVILELDSGGESSWISSTKPLSRSRFRGQLNLT